MKFDEEIALKHLKIFLFGTENNQEISGAAQVCAQESFLSRMQWQQFGKKCKHNFPDVPLLGERLLCKAHKL